jgi:hypothetical protein
MSVEISACLTGLDALAVRLDGACKQAVKDVAEMYQDVARVNTPVGTPGNTTAPPGTLAASIVIDGPSGGDGVYYAQLGPTTVYGRQRELGGHIYPGLVARSIGSEHIGGSERGKGLLVFTKFGVTIYATHVYQEGSFYMKRTVDEMPPGSVREKASAPVARAITGS